MIRNPRVWLAVLGVTLGACTPSLTPGQQAQERIRDACQAEANREFRQQNRYLLSEGDQSGTPFSSSGSLAAPSDGLSDQYRMDRSVASCVAEGGPAAPGSDIRSSTEAILNARQ